MAVHVKDIVLEKVATGPVSARVYQGAEFGKGSPIVLFFHGGAFLQSGVKDSVVAESLAKAGAIVAVPDYNAPLGNVFPKPLSVAEFNQFVFNAIGWLLISRTKLSNWSVIVCCQFGACSHFPP